MSEQDHRGPDGDGAAALPLEVVELLCSRLCHDLASPVGAINNGMELLGGEDLSARGEVMEMITSSGETAAARLKFFRAAYGRAGDIEGLRDLSTVRDIAAGVFTGARVRLVWPETSLAPPRPLSRQAVKLLLNLILLATAALPLGGDIVVRLEDVSGSLKVEAAAAGERAALNDGIRSAMSGSGTVKDLEPATVQAYFTAYLSRIQGAGLRVVENTGEKIGSPAVTFMVTLD